MKPKDRSQLSIVDELRQVLPLRLQVATLFVFFMWLFFQLYQPWQTIDRDLLNETGGFGSVTDLSDWVRETGRVEWSDDTGYVQLRPGARLRLNLPAFAGDLLLCRGRISTNALETGAQRWDAARILVYFEDADGRIHWSHPHNVGYLSGDSNWQSFTTMIEVPQFARKGWVELAHYGRSGTAAFDDISVSPALWKATYPRWQQFFGMLWAAILMWLVINTHFWDQRWGRAMLACGLLIIVGVTLPPTTMFQVTSSGVKLSQQVISTASEVFDDTTVSPTSVASPEKKTPPVEPTATLSSPPALEVDIADAVDQPVAQPSSPAPLSSVDLQKVGHSILFAGLGFFAFLAFFNQTRTGLLVYSLLLFALSTEVLQLAVDGRLFGLLDLGLDVLGIASGALLAWLYCRIRACP